MDNLLQIILEGSPLEVRDAVRTSLEEAVEKNLQETKKIVTAKLFSGSVVVEETIARKPWTKASIRESLEEAMLNKGRVANFNEAVGSAPSNHPLHKMI